MFQKKRIVQRKPWSLAAAIAAVGILWALPAYAGSWSKDEEGWRYLDDNGTAMSSQWVEDQGNWYYLNTHGLMQTGWLKLGDSWYYFEPDGSMATGTREIRGVIYKFGRDGSLSRGPATSTELGTGLAPNVESAMCSAEYWIDRIHGAEQLLMTGEEIQALNQKIRETPETMVMDLSALPGQFDGRELADSQANFASPKGLYLNGQPVPESYYEAIRRNIRGAAVSEHMTLRYGFAVNRTEMKAYPYGDFLSDSLTDPEWDNLVNTAVRVNEPLAIYYYTADGKYAFVKSSICPGWVPTADIAVCRDKAEWEDARRMDQVLVVTGEKIYLEASTAYPESSEKCLTMGTVLELVSASDETINNRLPWNSYVVKLPHRNTDGSFSQKVALIPANRDVNVGYLPFSVAGILRQAFKCLGNRYGWGGMLNSQDCSGFVGDVYKCFGLEIPRNTTWQAAMPVEKCNMSDMSEREKEAALQTLLPGTILQFPGHEMIYLGKANGHYYTINDVSSLVSPPEGTTGDAALRVRSVIVNDLSTLRKNGKSWFDQITRGIVVVK